MTDTLWSDGIGAGAILPDHPLFDLQTIGALMHPRVRVIVDLEDAAEAEALAHTWRRTFPRLEPELLVDGRERVLGLVVDTPGLTALEARTAGRVLADHAQRWAILPGLPRAVERALAWRRLTVGRLTARGVHAVRLHAPDRDLQLVDSHLFRRPRDPDLMELIASLEDGLRRVAPDLCPPESIRVSIRHRDGVAGLHMPLQPGPQPADLVAHQAWAVVVDHIFGWMGHQVIRLAPAGRWWDALGVHLWVPLLLPPAPPPPAARRLAWGSWHLPGPRCDRAVAAVGPSGSLDDALALLDDAEPAEPEGGAIAAVEGRPRATATPPAGVRLSPSAALGMGSLAMDVRPIPHRGGGRWLVRWRDELRDVDLIEDTTSRPADARDRALAERLTRALQHTQASPAPEVEDAWLRPVADSAGAPGVQLRLATQPVSTDRTWQALLDALSGPDVDLGPMGTIGLGRTALVVHLWYHQEDASPPTWTAVSG